MYFTKFFRRILWIVNFVAIISYLSSTSRIKYRDTAGNEWPNNIEKRVTPRRSERSEQSNIPNYSKKNSCEGRCTNHTEWGYRKCYCDPDCYLVSNDCCTDYIKYCKPLKTVGRPTKKYNYSCKGLLMVTQCPFGSPNNTVRAKCETPNDEIKSVKDIYGFMKVTGDDNTTFRNAYCASCNGVMNFKPWNLVSEKLTCKNEYDNSVSPNFNFTKTINTLLSHSKSIKTKRPKNVPARFCRTSSIIDYCPDGIQHLSCTYGNVMIVSYQQKFYKNIHCATCHGKQEQFGCSSSSIVGLHFSSLTAVLNHKEYLTVVKKHILDISGAIPDDNPWVMRFYVNVWLQHPLNVENNFSFTPREFHDSLAKHLNVSHLELFDTKTATALPPQGTTYSYKVYSMIVQIQRKNFDLLFKNPIANTSSPETVFLNYIHFSKLFTLEIKGVHCNVTKASFRPLLCLEKTNFTAKEYELQQQGRVFVPSTNRTYEKHEYYNQTVEKNDEKRGNITVCERILPTKCNGSIMDYTSEEYSVMTNLSIYVNKTLSFYSYGAYVILSNKSIGICQNFVTITSKTIRGYEALGYITFISFLLSTISLIFVLITYVIFPQLRTLPGKNLMNFSTSLMLFMIFWLLSDIVHIRSNIPTCKAIAIIEHYFLMASFVSMSVIALHTYIVFAKNVPAPKMSEGRERKRFCEYLALVWLLPAFFVGICVVLDRQVIQKMGYGESGICWMSEPNAYIYFVIIPIAVLLLFNIVAFSITAVYLRKHSRNRAARQATGNRRSNLSIYAKLSTLMGFSWLFGLLALIVTSTMVFWYLFVIFTSLHGVFVAFAFVFNSKTFNLYKQKFVNSKSASKFRRRDGPIMKESDTKMLELRYTETNDK